jgi:uncharacterized protein
MLTPGMPRPGGELYPPFALDVIHCAPELLDVYVPINTVNSVPQNEKRMEIRDPIAQFTGRRYINLESYKKDGSPKLTPVQSIEDKGLIYLRTDPRTWKVKRIRRNPNVRIVPSDRSGKPAGTWIKGDARILRGEESDRVMKLFREEYGSIGNMLVDFVGHLRGERLTTIISIKPQP